MITIEESKIAELMFDIWHKSNDLKNPVIVGKYIADELTKVKLNLPVSSLQLKEKQTPTFDEFIDKFSLETDRDNEYFFDNEYFDALSLYYKYAETYKVKP